MINTQDIARVLTQGHASNNSIGALVLEYAQLRHKIDNPETQSWFFLRGIESNLKRLKDLKSSYNSTRKYYNSKSLDDLILLLNEKQEKLREIRSRKCSGSITMMGIYVNSLKSGISELNEYIAMKKHIRKLSEIDSLISDVNRFTFLLELDC